LHREPASSGNRERGNLGRRFPLYETSELPHLMRLRLASEAYWATCPITENTFDSTLLLGSFHPAWYVPSCWTELHKDLEQKVHLTFWTPVRCTNLSSPEAPTECSHLRFWLSHIRYWSIGHSTQCLSSMPAYHLGRLCRGKTSSAQPFLCP
jgi:hypothetical protein